jgi:DNA-binding XRE family transcriptional regulator
MPRVSEYDRKVKPRLSSVKAWSRDGLTREQIAQNLHISRHTLYDYEKAHIELHEMFAEGFNDHIANVENAQAKAAQGYEYEERKIIYDTDAKGKPTKIVKIEVMKKYQPPNIVAGIFILKNRDNKKWRDSMQLTGKDGGDLAVQLTIVGSKDDTGKVADK